MAEKAHGFVVALRADVPDVPSEEQVAEFLETATLEAFAVPHKIRSNAALKAIVLQEMGKREADVLCRKRIGGGNWKQTFAREAVARRFLRLADVVETSDLSVRCLDTFAMALNDLPDGLAGTVFRHVCRRHVFTATVKRQLEIGNEEWCLSLYRRHVASREVVAAEVFHKRDVKTFCAIIRILKNIPFGYHSSAFHNFGSDAGDVVRTAREARCWLSISDAYENHRAREEERKGNPGVSPLPRAFYLYALGHPPSHGTNVLRDCSRVIKMCAEAQLSDDLRDDKIEDLLHYGATSGGDACEVFSYLRDRSPRIVKRLFSDAFVVGIASAANAAKKGRV
nr:hypothetical protein TetV2_00551 [Oceanusvirus sp.]